MRHLLPEYYRAVIVMNFTVVMWWCGVVRAVGGGDMKIDVAVAPISCSGNFLTNHAAWLGWAGLHPSRSNYQQQPGHGRDVIRNSLATANNAHI